MYKRDERLVEFHRYLNDERSARYQSVISMHPFPRLHELLDWLEKQISTKLPSKDEQEVELAVISDLLIEGDTYYETLFR